MPPHFEQATKLPNVGPVVVFFGRGTIRTDSYEACARGITCPTTSAIVCYVLNKQSRRMRLGMAQRLRRVTGPQDGAAGRGRRGVSHGGKAAMKVLIVDDVGYVRHYLDRLVTRHGHIVVTAASGQEALEILRNDNQIDIVITDLLMPGLDGTELFQAARRIERFNDEGPISPPAFILITAIRPGSAAPRKELNLLQQAVDLGFADVMLKPVDNKLLIQRLAAIQQQRLDGKHKTDCATDNPNPANRLKQIDEAVTEILTARRVPLLRQLLDNLAAHTLHAEEALRQLRKESPSSAERLFDEHSRPNHSADNKAASATKSPIEPPGERVNSGSESPSASA